MELGGLIHLSMMRAKYRSSSILCSWVRILSCFKSCYPCFSLIAWSSDLKNDCTIEDVPPGLDSVAMPIFYSPSEITHFSFTLKTYNYTRADKNSLGYWRGFWLSKSMNIRVGKGSLWLTLFPHLWSTIRSNIVWPKCTGAPVPISNRRGKMTRKGSYMLCGVPIAKGYFVEAIIF